jgi:hypothetical protein
MTEPLRRSVVDIAELEPVIVKVTEPGYVPTGFTVRTRIDEILFTADARPADVTAAATDPNVESIDHARRLHQP